MQFSQLFNIIVSSDSLATGNPICHHNTLDIEENIEHGLDLRMICANLFCSCRVWWLAVQWMSFCFQVRYISKSHHNYQFQQIHFIRSVLQMVQTQFLLKFCSANSIFETISAQTFFMFNSLLKCIPVKNKHLRYCSNTQSMVFSKQISPSFNVVSGNSCAWMT